MIRREDLDAAIAECIGERDPNANTCIKLAAFYTIRNELYPQEAAIPEYSYAAEPVTADPQKAHINSDTEFAQAVRGYLLPMYGAWWTNWRRPLRCSSPAYMRRYCASSTSYDRH